MIWGVVYVSFGVSFVYRFLNRNFDVWDFQIVVFRKEVMANIDLSRKSRLVNFGMDFSCFGSLWSRFSHVVRFEKTGLKTKRLLVKSRILKFRSGEAGRAGIWALSIKT
jgi:hypothetical protein